MSSVLEKQTEEIRAVDPPRRTDGNIFVGDYITFLNDPVNYFLDTGKVGPVVRFRQVHLDHVLVTDADLAREILQTRNRNYVKEPRLMRIIKSGGEDVLFTTDGDEWLWRRRLMQPAFHRRQITCFCDTIVSEADNMVATWRDSETRDMDEEMKLVTMMVIGRTMFNVDMAGDSAELHTAYKTFSEFIVKRISYPDPFPLWFPTKSHRRFWQARDTIIAALTTIIEDRRQSSETHDDLLDMLLAMVGVEGGFTQEQLMYEMSSIVFAGHETTAATLTWVLFMLTQHPAVEQRVIAEIDSVVGERQPTMNDLANLTYLNQVINETMRLYPVARATNRQAVEADVLGGYNIRAGENIYINIQGIQRDGRYWDDPMRFDPDRFSAERSADRHKWAFLPFLNGPRKCIGEPLSRVEMQLILVTMLQCFRFRLPVGAVVEEEAGFVLQPKGGLELILEAR